MAENRNRKNEIEEANTETDSQPWRPPTQDASVDERRQMLYRAAMEGKWETAQKIFRESGIAKTEKVSPMGLTALHVAALCGKSEFVTMLVKELGEKELEATDLCNRTALHYVAMSASVDAAKAMVEKNGKLPQLKDQDSEAPILCAARWRHRSKTKEMLEYLYQVTKEDEKESIYSGSSGANLVVAITASGCYDFALDILQKHPDLASAQNENGMSILHVFAMRPSAFRDGHELSLWESFIYKVVYKEETIDRSDDANRNAIEHRQLSAFVLKLSPIIQAGMKKVLEIAQTHADSVKLVQFVCRELRKKDDSKVYEYFSHEYNRKALLHLAVENGVFKLVQVCLNYFPDLTWQVKNNRSLWHESIEHRRVEIFNHLLDLAGGNAKILGDYNDENDNNILHLAAQYSEQFMTHSDPGPAFQMRRELQWFKAVEALVYEEFRMQKNEMKKKINGQVKNKMDKEITRQVPRELFFTEHEQLLKDAKEWMKDTSNSCMLVSTLVGTVAFAAMITVPGGNNSDTGLPVLSNKKLFVAFSLSNALSMVSSAVTLLMFLSVYTSRFTEEDFLVWFPNILQRGLISLFIAITTMMIAFGIAIGLALQRTVKWAYIPITIIACCPALIFIRLQLPLLFRTMVFAPGPSIYRGQKDRESWRPNKTGNCLLSKDMP